MKVSALATALVVWAGAVSAADVPLIEAARHRDAQAVAVLVQQGADVDARQPDGTTALHWAAQWDDLQIARLLLEAGARADRPNDYGATPLAIAALNGSAEMIRALVVAGADPDAALPSGETALMTAARSGTLAAVEALAGAGANLNAAESSRGQTGLMWAVAEGHLDVVRFLVESGADPLAESAAGFTPLLFAARVGSRDLVRVLLDAGADVNAAAEDGSTPLVVATVRGHAPLAEWLLDQGADPNNDAIGYTALHWAAGTFDTRSTREYPMDTGEWSALAGIKSRAEKLSLIRALLSKGADVNARLKGRPPRFGYSLGGGSIVGGGAIFGATPFFLAATVGDMDVMRVLLASGADPLLPTNDKTTPLLAASGISFVEGESSASEADLLEALQFIMALGGDLMAVNDAGNTPLHAATYVGLTEIARFVVDQGVPVNARNRKDETALKIANGIPINGMFYVQPETAALLRTLGGTE